MSEYTLTESRELQSLLIHNLMMEYSKYRPGIHMSDLVLCLRQSLGRKLYPSLPNRKQLGYFFDGARRHEALQELYGKENVAEWKGEFEGVSYSIDIYDDYPIEFKTTRANKAVSDHWLRQLSYYMLAMGATKGILQVQRINDRTGEPLPAYWVTMDAAQRERALSEFHDRVLMFKTALERKDLALAPIYRGDGEWVCRECPYKVKCDVIEGRKK